MSWIKSAVKDYFLTTNKERVSYVQFLHRTKPQVIKHCTSQTNFNDLESLLYNNFKANVDDGTPIKALRRFTTSRFWDEVKSECLVQEYEYEKNCIAQQYKKDSLALANQARQYTTEDLSNALLGPEFNRKRKQRATESSRHNTMNHERSERPGDYSDETDDNGDNPFADHTPLDHARSSLIKYRMEAKHVSELHKQDLLFYGIIDLSPTSASKFRTHMSKESADAITSLVDEQQKKVKGHANEVKEYVAGITSTVDNLHDFRDAIKEAKQELRKKKDNDTKWKKSTIRLMKHFRDMYTDDGSSMLYRRQSELNYNCKFISPLLTELFKHTKDIEWQWGDMSLDEFKEEEAIVTKDNETRLKGPMPDGLFKLTEYGLTIALMEVSGPPNIQNHAHFVGDKIKLGKLLKRLLKKIRQILKREGDRTLYQQIKLYGLQLYRHKLHVYSIGELAHGLYVFREELCFDMACEIGLIANFTPRYLRNLTKVQLLLSQSAESIKAYINSDSMGNSSDCSSDSRDSVYISPKKKSKARKVRSSLVSD